MLALAGDGRVVAETRQSFRTTMSASIAGPQRDGKFLGPHATAAMRRAKLSREYR